MSGVLGRFYKQPVDVLDYDFDFSDWLTDRADTILSFTVTADTGLTVGDTSTVDGVVKVFLSGGTSGQQYKVTCTVVTNGGRTKQAELAIKVKEV